MSLLATHGDAFPVQLYLILENALGRLKANRVLTFVASRRSQYDPSNDMYDNCKPEHREKVWLSVQVIMEVQRTQSTSVKTQIRGRLQPLIDEWILGGAITESPTEIEGLHRAMNKILAVIIDTIREHPAGGAINKVFKKSMTCSNDIDVNKDPYCKAPTMLHQGIHDIKLGLRALVKVLGDKQAVLILWEAREAIMKGKQDDEERWCSECFECEWQ
jgi:hypothetical protein